MPGRQHTEADLEADAAALSPLPLLSLHTYLRPAAFPLLLQVSFEDDCTKIIMQFVVKLTPKKGCERFPKFVQGLAASLYLDKPICDVHEVGCHTHGVDNIEVGV